MRISVQQLEMALSKLRYSLLGFSSDHKDLVVEISISQEDPGSGVMTDSLLIKATKPPQEGKETHTDVRMEVEIYPEDQKLEPRASKIESFKITGKY